MEGCCLRGLWLLHLVDVVGILKKSRQDRCCLVGVASKIEARIRADSLYLLVFTEIRVHLLLLGEN